MQLIKGKKNRAIDRHMNKQKKGKNIRQQWDWNNCKKKRMSEKEERRNKE
jgi:hypothetical protein